MRRLIPFLLAILLLPGCSKQADSSPTDSTPENDVAVQEVITPESLRKEYEAEGFIVREIVLYEGDYLVYYGSEPCNGIFQWVYTNTGLRAPLLFSGWEVLDYDILQPGQIRVLTGGSNVFNSAAMRFPVYEYATACLPLNRVGIPLAQDSYGSGIVQKETYWAPLDVSHTFGWSHGTVALVDICINANGVEAVFGPTAHNLDGFFAAASDIPVTEPVYDEDTHTLTLRFRNTSLTSGVRTEFSDEADRKNYETAQENFLLPTAFPTGRVNGSNDFISSAEVREEGSDTLLILSLTRSAEQYTAETGQLLKNESRPYLRLSLRDTWKY